MTRKRQRSNRVRAASHGARPAGRQRRPTFRRAPSTRRRTPLRLPSELPFRPSFVLMALAGGLFVWQLAAPAAGEEFSRWLSPRAAGTSGVLLLAAALGVFALEAAGLRRPPGSRGA